MKFAHAFQLAMNSKEILLYDLLLTCSCQHDGRTQIRFIRRAPRAPIHIAPLQAVRARHALGFQLSLKEFLLCDLVLAGRCRINVQRIHLDGSTHRIRLILMAPHAPNIGKVQAVRLGMPAVFKSVPRIFDLQVSNKTIRIVVRPDSGPERPDPPDRNVRSRCGR